MSTLSPPCRHLLQEDVIPAQYSTTWNCTFQHALSDNSFPTLPRLLSWLDGDVDGFSYLGVLTEATACSSCSPQGQRQQHSEYCVTRGPSNHGYLMVPAVKKLLGGQHLVPVFSFLFVFFGGASKYFKNIHQPTAGHCHWKHGHKQGTTEMPRPLSLQIRHILKILC